jgi:hypothetical protein
MCNFVLLWKREDCKFIERLTKQITVANALYQDVRVNKAEFQNDKLVNMCGLFVIEKKMNVKWYSDSVKVMLN